MVALAPYLILLLVAILVVVLAAKLRFPYTIALVLLGAGLGVVAQWQGWLNVIGGANNILTPDLFFYILLPPIIFEAGLHVNYRNLRARAPFILFLVFVGVLFTTFFTGFLIASFLAIPLAVALLLAAILSPTDPVAVVDLLHRLKVPGELSSIVESESLLNDAVGVILFVIVLQFINNGNVTLEFAVLHFLWLAGAGVGVGALAALLVYFLHRRLDDPAVETALSVVLAYGTFLVAQDIGASGIAATAIAGIAVGTWVAPRTMGPQVQYSLGTFWKVVVYITTSVIFLSMGLIFAISNVMDFLGLILLLLVLLFVGRALFVYAHRPLARIFVGRKAQLPQPWYGVLTFAGIRGAIPIALAFTLVATSSNLTSGQLHMIISAVIGVAIFSVVVGNIISEWYVHRHFRSGS
ncbi:MAG: cation:proton antiporter [Candidatus Thermoplasmatota archaeon]|jgi:CPA1 family monovalent cation:H+ antiporter|nr:cation:proton antiporter [Candidatus Thermoplasmatota archaeon]